MTSTDAPAVALVAAAGSGTRLGASKVKALVEVRGRPLVAHAVASLAAGGVEAAVVTIPVGLDADFAAALGDASIPVTLVTGGAERQESVLRGLGRIDDDAIVLVHDAARPFVPAEVVASVIDAVRQGASAVTPVIPVVDSVRRVDESGSHVVDRSLLRAIQTPQGFDAAVLRHCHERAVALGRVVTDDVSLCEAEGYAVHLVPGSRASFKITDPFDLQVAEALQRT